MPFLPRPFGAPLPNASKGTLSGLGSELPGVSALPETGSARLGVPGPGEATEADDEDADTGAAAVGERDGGRGAALAVRGVLGRAFATLWVAAGVAVGLGLPGIRSTMGQGMPVRRE